MLNRRFCLYVGIACALAAIAGFIADSMRGRGGAVNPLLISPPVPSEQTYTTYKVPTDIWDEEVFYRNNAVAAGRLWSFRRDEIDRTLFVTWKDVDKKLSTETVWVRLAQRMVNNGNLQDALSLANEQWDSSGQSAILVAITTSIRQQSYPIADRPNEKPRIIVGADLEQPQEDNSWEEEWSEKNQELKRTFIEQKHKEFENIYVAAKSVPDTEAKAELLEHLADAFVAVADDKNAEQCLADASKCLAAMREQRTGFRATIVATLSAAGRTVLWPILVVVGAVLLAICREAFSHYARKLAGQLATDPELARKFGKTLQQSGLILPTEYSKGDQAVDVHKQPLRTVPR
jgi:hypothetical protein